MKSILFAVILFFFFCSNSNAQAHKTPPMNGVIPSMAKTGWGVIKIHAAGKDYSNGDVIVFCKVNHWDYVPGTGNSSNKTWNQIGANGTFTQQGTTLTLTDGMSHKPTVYKMSWDAQKAVLTLSSGDVIYYLKYNGETTCNG